MTRTAMRGSLSKREALVAILRRFKAHLANLLLYVESRAYTTAREFVSPLEYHSLERQIRDAHEWIREMPKDFEIVVGIPRLGLIVGAVIAEELNLPLSTPDHLVKGEYWHCHEDPRVYDTDHCTVLLVDDGIGSGATMRAAEDLIHQHKPEVAIRRAPMYVFPSRDTMDLYTFYRYYQGEPITELQCFHQGELGGPIGADMDGVLCEENPAHTGTPEYEAWLPRAKPYRLPMYEFAFIATGRLEKYREVTEQWLREHGVRYGRLYMRNSLEENPLLIKTRAILRERPRLYFESSPSEARLLRILTGVPVICTENLHAVEGVRSGARAKFDALSEMYREK